MTTTLKRTDIHRPSIVNPADYEFVAVEVTRDDGDIGGAMMAAEQRRIIRRHMEITGGNYSRHAHGGNCHVCGAHAIYTVLWYHAETNTYIRTGEDCADKLWNGDEYGFQAVRGELRTVRGELRTARENRAGKAKAELILRDAGLSRGWEIFNATDEELEPIAATVRKTIGACECYKQWKPETIGETCRDCGQERKKQEWFNPTNELRTLRDIIGRLVKYGNISEKAEKYLRSLVDQIDNRKQKEAERAAKMAAERAAASDCPTGRVEIVGTPISVKRTYSQYGDQIKWLIKTVGGWKAFGTVPTALLDEIAGHLTWRDDDRATIDRDVAIVATFTAKMQPSDDDEKFGFYSRPTKASVEIR
jgi:hypothetical protein